MKKLLLFVLLIAAIATMAACGPVTPAPQEPAAQAPAEAPAALTELKIATQPWIGYGPWYIAQAKGFFEKHGLKVELWNLPPTRI
jgi:NitT/TauT family transport system substrate-binding protein